MMKSSKRGSNASHSYGDTRCSNPREIKIGLRSGKVPPESDAAYFKHGSKSIDECHTKTSLNADGSKGLQRKWVYSVPVCLAFVLYLNTLSAGFVYDDHRAIVSNPDVIGDTPLSSVWQHDFWGASIRRKGSHGSWRPLTTLSFRLNALWAKSLPSQEMEKEARAKQISASSSWHFHAVNVLLHVLVTGIYVALLEKIDIDKGVCLLAGSLFACHPVHVEAVGGVVGRAELLGALAFCLAIGAYIFYIRGRPCWMAMKMMTCPCLPLKNLESKPEDASILLNFRNILWLWCSVFCAVIGVMCKEQAITSLAVGIILHCTLIAYVTPDKKSLLLTIFKETWLSCALTALVLWWRLSITISVPSFTVMDNPASHASSVSTRALTIIRYWVEHVRLLLLPDVLSFDWSMGAVPLVTSVLDKANLPGAILICLLLVFVYQLSKKLPQTRLSEVTVTAMLATCNDALNNNQTPADSVWRESYSTVQARRHHISLVLSSVLLIVPFLPASNLWSWVGFVAAERVLYLPSMGSSLLIAQGAYHLANIPTDDCISSGASNSKSTNHRKLERRKHIRNFVGVTWFLLILLMSARTIKRNWDWHSDETLYRSAVNICPPKAFANLGVVYSEQGRLDEAEKAYRAALTFAPQMAETHYNLGLLLANTNRLQTARKSYEEALRYRPWFAQAYLSLAQVLIRLGLTQEATKVLELCLEHNNAPAKDGSSHAWAITNCRQRLARIYVTEDRPYDALDELQLAYFNAPAGFPIYNLLTLKAEAFVTAGEYREAQEVLEKALKHSPDSVTAHLAFSRLLLANGSRFEEAEEWLRRAVSLAPNDAHVFKRLGQLRLEQGRAEEAIDPWLRAVHLDSSDHTAAFNAATALRLAGKNRHAEVLYQKAVKILPRDVSSHRNLGAILHLNGKLEGALKHYTIALQLVPNDPQTTINLQRLAALLKKKRPL